jgi:hypothetical protein
MNTLKKINISIALLITTMFFVTINCSAQQRQGQGQGQPPIPNDTQINKMVEDLSAELSLSDAQKTEILALYQNHFAEVKSSMSSGEKPSREEMESLKEEFEDDVKSLLNDDQQDLYDEFVKKNQKQDRQRPNRR